MNRLCLLGEPTLEIGDQKVEIVPRASFELLALIIYRYPTSVTRQEGTNFLFGHLKELSSEQAARQQLRTAIWKLRKQLDALSVSDQFSLHREVLSLNTAWQIDVFQPLTASTLADLEVLIKDIAPTWDRSRWHGLRQRYAASVALKLVRLLNECSNAEMRFLEGLRLSEKGRQLFPFEPSFAEIHRRLSEMGSRNIWEIPQISASK